MAAFREKGIFIWNDWVIGDTEKVTGLLVSAGFEAAYLHSTNVGNWRTTTRPALAAALKAAGITVYAAVAVYGDKTIYGWTPTEEGHKAAAIVNEYGLAGCIFDVETGAYERATNGATLIKELLNAYAAMTDKPAAFCGWAQYDNAHPVDVLKAAMGHSAVTAGMPMAYWYNGELPTHAETTAARAFAQWRKYTAKNIVMAGRAYTDTFKLSDGTSMTVHARPDAIAAFEAKSRQLGACGVTWWDMEHALPIEGVWDALAATPGFSEPQQPEEPGEQTMWTDKAIGFIATSKTEAAWENDAFNFVVARAGGSNWVTRADGSLVYPSNDDLAPMELKAHAKGWPFIALWDFDLDYYVNGQFGPSDALWPPLSNDYPYKALVDALQNRDIDGLIIRVMNRKNLAGKDQMMSYLAFAAMKFVERANTWLYQNKGLDKWCFVLTNDDFLRQDGKQENFYAWLKNWYVGIEQEAVRPLASGAWPQSTDKIKAIPPSLGWKFWKHYDTSSLDMLIFNGDTEALKTFLGYGATTPPPNTDPQDPPTTLEARVTALEARLTALETHTHEMSGPK